MAGDVPDAFRSPREWRPGVYVVCVGPEEGQVSMTWVQPTFFDKPLSHWVDECDPELQEFRRLQGLLYDPNLKGEE